MTDDLSVCECGHIFDEHDDGAECQAVTASAGDCACVYFEENPDPIEPSRVSS